MSQISFLDGSLQYKIKKPIRLIELFAGIGSQAKALSRLGVNFEHYKICEFDKYAVKSYNAIHGTCFEPSDITKLSAQDLNIVETDKYEYIMTYSFPCQDLSKAGKQHGMDKGCGTRSGLLWEVERLLDECIELPQILLMENVPDVIGEKNVKNFAKWVEKLESIGYYCKWQILNAKEHGVPQNRARCFMVSILSKDIYYEFPETQPLFIRLKDVLEKSVDEKYYLSEKTIKALNSHLERNRKKGNGFGWKPTDGNGVDTIKTESGYRPDSNFIIEKYVEFIDKSGYIPEMFNPYHTNELKDIAPTQTTQSGGVTTSASVLVAEFETRTILLKNKGQELYKETEVAPTHLSRDYKGFGKQSMAAVVEPRCILAGKLSGGKWDKMHDIARRYYDENGIAPTIHTVGGGNLEPKVMCEELQTIQDGETEIVVVLSRIRKLTPKECWRLMGFDDSDYDNAEKVNSNSQLYKQAGNSIVVNVLEQIFKKLL